MSKKKKSSKVIVSENPAYKQLVNMRHKDLKIACVLRGMPFEEVVNTTTPGLGSWFCSNYDKEQNKQLLDDFDDWLEPQLSDPALKHPMLRLGYSGPKDEEGNVIIPKTLKPKTKAPSKPRKERDAKTGIFKGTKKQLTYECAHNGETFEDTCGIVKEKYPEAVDKSIKIWYNRAKKEIANEEKG